MPENNPDYTDWPTIRQKPEYIEHLKNTLCVYIDAGDYREADTIKNLKDLEDFVKRKNIKHFTASGIVEETDEDFMKDLNDKINLDKPLN